MSCQPDDPTAITISASALHHTEGPEQSAGILPSGAELNPLEPDVNQYLSLIYAERRNFDLYRNEMALYDRLRQRKIGTPALTCGLQCGKTILAEKNNWTLKKRINFTSDNSGSQLNYSFAKLSTLG